MVLHNMFPDCVPQRVILELKKILEIASKYYSVDYSWTKMKFWWHCSVHSKEHKDRGGTEDDPQGGFQFCSLLDEELDIISRDTTCR